MSRKLLHGLTAAALVAVVAPPVRAQDRRVNLYVDAGGLSALRDLNDVGTSDFRTGFTMGGGVGWRLQRNVMVRGDLTWARPELRNNATASGIHVNQYFYGVDVDYRYPHAGRAAPYLFVGAGAVTMHPDGTSGQDKTKGVGRLGLGVTYEPPRSRLELFAQGTGWLYKVSGFPSTSDLAGYDRSQFALAYVGGVALRL